ncbi:glycosyltransferase [Bacillus aerolatus]|uniref:Glycosyltransferase n=1 Tax=Bacillus aerolatus TaxID=2653354 RepID=A0A6I1FGL6_9BACI|nr:glycosyltransferase family 4 protein [Bacillus aerolatus]KAB7707396.1 glycosyltransferase [Bacillus aerolatus]
MNIWIFNHYAIGPGSSGGTRHYDLAKQLIAKGHKVTIFASSYNHQTLHEEHLMDNKQLFVKKNYDGIEFIWIRTTPYHKNDINRVFNMISYSRRAYKIAKNIDQQPDIVIGSLVHPLAAYVGYLTSKKKKSTFYFEERDLWPQTLIDLGKVTARNPVIYGLASMEKFLYRKSKRIIVLFDKAVGYVTNKGIKKEKVLYLPNGIDLKRLDAVEELPSEVKQILEKNKDRVLAVYTGTHGLANNLDAILDSAKILKESKPSVHFLLVGNGPEKKRLIERKHKENISNLDFVDPLPKECIPALLSQCDIGLLPLKDSPVFKWGISPNKLFDYMGASLPVALLCNLDDTPVEKAGGGYVIKNNFSTELAKVLMTASKEDLHQLGQKARLYVEKEHNWALLSERLEKIMLADTKEMK